MQTTRLLSRSLALAALGSTLAAALPAHAVSISASSSATSILPATVDPWLDLQNGDFLIHANLSASAPHVTGDGIDETTTWTFDFTGDSQYAAFLAGGDLVSARLTLRLNTAFLIDGVGPITDHVFPSDGVIGIFPAWVMPPFISGTFGTYATGSITADLVADVGMNANELRSWLTSHNGLFPMIYADDAIVGGAVLELVSAPVPEPGTWALMLGGLVVAAGAAARRGAARQRPRSAACPA